MTTSDFAPVRQYDTLVLTRKGRLLTITLNRPELLNAVNLRLHEELADVFTYAAADAHSDVVVLTGAGRAFSAGGDIDHILNLANNPDLFHEEVRLAKRIVFSMLDLDKPLVCRMNGHAVGLGATLALFCDVIFAVEKAKIGDPHVGVRSGCRRRWGGDLGATHWPWSRQRIFDDGRIAHREKSRRDRPDQCTDVPAEELDSAVDAFCEKMLNGSKNAIRWTKTLTNLELKRVAHAVLDAGLAYESLSLRSADHREAVQAMQEKRAPVFGDKSNRGDKQ